MKEPALPGDEESRLAALNHLGIVYSPAEERFDRITRITKRIFDVPIALVSLVASNIQWFKSCQGLTLTETPREISFCGHAILMDEPLIVPDALNNPDFADNPLVTGEPFIRFYAGQAVQYAGKKIGTLCVIDTRPRSFLPSDLDALRSLAAWVENELKISVLSEVQNELIAECDELQRKVLIDPHTGTWNRQGMEEVLKLAFSRTERTKANVTIMMIEPDDSKNINPDYLHNASEIASKEIAQRIRSSVRTHDVIARYDSKKFQVFLADCNKETVRTIAQRILRTVAIEPIQIQDDKVMMTLTIGMACNEGISQWDWGKLIEIADSALYAAKANGGNQSLLGVYG
jgi:diguanylate cyclase (GGDEF)-like protein